MKQSFSFFLVPVLCTFIFPAFQAVAEITEPQIPWASLAACCSAESDMITDEISGSLTLLLKISRWPLQPGVLGGIGWNTDCAMPEFPLALAVSLGQDTSLAAGVILRPEKTYPVAVLTFRTETMIARHSWVSGSLELKGMAGMAVATDSIISPKTGSRPLSAHWITGAIRAGLSVSFVTNL